MLRDKMDLDENVETNDRVTEVRKLSFIDILVPVLTLITIVNCVVILILVMNIGRKVNGLEQRLLLLEKKELYEEYEAVRKETSTELPDSENFSEVSEVADTFFYNPLILFCIAILANYKKCCFHSILCKNI